MTSIVTVDGHEVRITNGDRENARAWFMYSDKDYSDASMALKEVPMIYHGLDTSIAQISDYLQTVDNECTILGFSQGATFCHLLSILAHHATQANNADCAIAPFAKIKRAILVSGFSHMHQEPLAASIRCDVKNSIQLQSLHVYGEGDTSVPKHFSCDLAKCYMDPDIYVHEKGHYIPHNKPLIDRVVQFLKS